MSLQKKKLGTVVELALDWKERVFFSVNCQGEAYLKGGQFFKIVSLNMISFQL